MEALSTLLISFFEFFIVLSSSFAMFTFSPLFRIYIYFIYAIYMPKVLNQFELIFLFIFNFNLFLFNENDNHLHNS